MSDISEAVRRNVRAAAGDRCGNCLAPQHLVLAPLEIEHLTPKARGGSDDEDNLWLACRLCNGFKAAQSDAIDPITGQRAWLFNPRHQSWDDHFCWSGHGVRMLGLTPCGRATAVTLQLNNPSP